MNKSVIIIVVLLLLVGIVLFFRRYNKHPGFIKDVSKTEKDISLTINGKKYTFPLYPNSSYVRNVDNGGLLTISNSVGTTKQLTLQGRNGKVYGTYNF